MVVNLACSYHQVGHTLGQASHKVQNLAVYRHKVTFRVFKDQDQTIGDRKLIWGFLRTAGFYCPNSLGQVYYSAPDQWMH